MDVNPLFQGVMIGLTLAAPVGPISLMCIRRTVAGGRYHGIASGMGVATADSVYAAVTVLGLTAISGIILANQSAFRILAAVVLVGVGFRICLSSLPEVCEKARPEPYLRDYVSMGAVAIANPLTIIFFAAILPGFGVVVSGASLIVSAEFVAGVFLGSTVWWVFLCGVLGSLRSCITSGMLTRINRISGSLIVCFGVGMILLVVFPI